MSPLPTVYLSRSAAQRVVRGHPWLFKGMIEKHPQNIEDGDLVQVRDSKRRPLGIGFWNSRSKLAVRIISRSKVEVGLEFFRHKIRTALQQRFETFQQGDSFRLIHAEADGLSGLIVDLYGDTAVIQISSVGIERHKDQIVEAIVAECQVNAICERDDIQTRKLEGLTGTGGVLFGQPGDHIEFQMNHLKWITDWKGGHKTGCYLDQQQNYQLVASHCANKSVLDAFTFQGGFALHAISNKAKKVVALDQSKQALDVGNKIQKLNDLPGRVDWTHTNVFDWLTKATQTEKSEDQKFDIIILDPPSFARNRASLNQAFRGYKELHLRALKLLKKGGVLFTFSCSHHVSSEMYEQVVMDAAFDCRKILRRIDTFSQSNDHPIVPVIPETEYLKGFAYKVTEI